MLHNPSGTSTIKKSQYIISQLYLFEIDFTSGAHTFLEVTVPRRYFLIDRNHNISNLSLVNISNISLVYGKVEGDDLISGEDCTAQRSLENITVGCRMWKVNTRAVMNGTQQVNGSQHEIELGTFYPNTQKTDCIEDLNIKNLSAIVTIGIILYNRYIYFAFITETNSIPWSDALELYIWWAAFPKCKSISCFNMFLYV